MISLRSIVTGEKAKVLFDQAIYSGNGFISAIILCACSAPGRFRDIFRYAHAAHALGKHGNALLFSLSARLSAPVSGSNYNQFPRPCFRVALIAILTGCVVLLQTSYLLSIFPWSSMVFPALVFTACFLLHDFFRNFPPKIVLQQHWRLILWLQPYF